MIWVETPSNPLLKLIDLEAVARFAAENQLLSICDNTFASPWIQRPLELGFDLVLHSATKYLNGHSDIVGGVAVVGDRLRLGAGHRQTGFSPERGRRGRRTIRQFSGHARAQDFGAADGTPLCECTLSCLLARATS